MEEMGKRGRVLRKVRKVGEGWGARGKVDGSEEGSDVSD
jgi:hypothetical protein